MGAIISLFGSESKYDIGGIILDLENRVNISNESELYDECNLVLEDGKKILELLDSYPSAEKEIRSAMSNPTQENERVAIGVVLINVISLKKFYDFGQKIQDIFPRVLTILMQHEDDQKHTLEVQKDLLRQLIYIVDFVLQWDDAKMSKPFIQNEFSFYRRNLSKLQNSKEFADKIVIKDELANLMSFFFASPTPLMNALTNSASDFLKNDASSFNVTRDSVINGLSIIANVCYDFVYQHKYTSEHINLVSLRAMTGCIILVDHLSEVGAFHKKTTINIKGCVNVLKSHSDGNKLLSILRWNTKHLNDPDVPPSIKNLLT